jgi:hypothetical protein
MGWVPQVRQSVPGKKTGEAHNSFHLSTSKSRVVVRKAIETYHFRPRYALANLGTRPVPIGSCYDTDFEGLG